MSHSDVIELAALLVEDTGKPADQVARLVQELTVIARRQNRRNETACNRELTVREQAKDVRDCEKARSLAAELGVTVRFNTDPRGYALYVNLPGGRSNSWGEDGWGI